jgi:hypothetical protein
MVSDLLIRDETATGRVLGTWHLLGLPDLVTARELVRRRVREALTAPDAVTPDGGWETAADEACTAFAHNGFVLLVGERQIASLDEIVDVREEPEVVFIRLIALAGG